MTLVNHGCDGTYIIGTAMNVTEQTVDEMMPRDDVLDYTNDAYDPFSERHFPQRGPNALRALRDIAAGEELLGNYLIFAGIDWKRNIRELKAMCFASSESGPRRSMDKTNSRKGMG